MNRLMKPDKDLPQNDVEGFRQVNKKYEWKDRLAENRPYRDSLINLMNQYLLARYRERVSA